MIRLVATSRRARAHSDEPITTGSAGIPIALTLSEDFDGLATTLVCEAGGTSRDLAVMGGELVVPHELLTNAGDTLTLGVYAALPDGTIVIPTVWAVAGEVVQGTVPSETSPSDPTPSWAAQVQQVAAQAVATANSVREDADAGAFDGDPGPRGPRGETGPTGPQGPTGADGISPTASVERVEGGARVTVTDASGTTTAMLYDAIIVDGSVTTDKLAQGAVTGPKIAPKAVTPDKLDVAMDYVVADGDLTISLA